MGGLCGSAIVFVLNAEYHADKTQSFTCNCVNGEVQLLESRDLLQKQLVPYHSIRPGKSFLKGSWEEIRSLFSLYSGMKVCGKWLLNLGGFSAVCFACSESCLQAINLLLMCDTSDMM